jgi:sec-independent protein translocase protein TatA
MQTIMIIGGLSGMELAIILIIVLMVFGVGKLPSVFRQLGTGLRDFQGALRGDEEDGEATPPKEIEDNSEKAATASNATATKQTTDAW